MTAGRDLLEEYQQLAIAATNDGISMISVPSEWLACVLEMAKRFYDKEHEVEK